MSARPQARHTHTPAQCPRKWSDVGILVVHIVESNSHALARRAADSRSRAWVATTRAVALAISMYVSNESPGSLEDDRRETPRRRGARVGGGV